ncbi:ankyrin repeat-containing domain protein [Aspergillus carlsbadensis]|nr:ankyrin repeat-containing domain protein [Aspergillus carlsbadensis]
MSVDTHNLVCHAALYHLQHISDDLRDEEVAAALKRSPFSEYAALSIFLHAKHAGNRRVCSSFQGLEYAALQRLFTLWTRLFAWANRVVGPEGLSVSPWSLLFAACSANMCDLVDYIYARARDPGPQLNYGDETPLHVAAEKGHVESAQTLLEHGARWQSKSRSGCTPFISATLCGRLKFIEWAAAECASELTSYDLDTGLVKAAGAGHRGVVEALLRLGADPNYCDPDSGTPLAAAMRRTRDKALLRILLRAGANGPAQLRLAEEQRQNTQLLSEVIAEGGFVVRVGPPPSTIRRGSPFRLADEDTRKRSRGSGSVFYNHGRVGHIESGEDGDGTDSNDAGGSVFINSHGHVANQSRGSQNLRNTTWYIGSHQSARSVSTPAAAPGSGTQGRSSRIHNYGTIIGDATEPTTGIVQEVPGDDDDDGDSDGGGIYNHGGRVGTQAITQNFSGVYHTPFNFNSSHGTGGQ